MKKKRLQTILSFLSFEDKLIDIGTDHAYIPVEAAKMGLTKILATDIHEHALESAQENISKSHYPFIETKLCDGLEGIDTKDYNTLVLAGMGTSTIEHILKKEKLETIQKIIVQSNHDLEDLRRFMNELGYTLKEEVAVEEGGHFYLCMCYIKGTEVLTKEEFLFEKKQKKNIFYYQYLIEKYESMMESVPEEKQKLLQYYIETLKGLLNN